MLEEPVRGTLLGVMYADVEEFDTRKGSPLKSIKVH